MQDVSGVRDVIIVDTTLRDGEQAAGIAFSAAEKITIAKMLDQAGIPLIEAGIPAMGRIEQEVIRAIVDLGLKSRILTWNRLNLKDIKASIDCGVKNIHISAPVSDIHIQYKLRKSRAWILENTKKAVCYARSAGCAVSVGAEDASRADFGFLVKFAGIALREGAERLRYADTLGIHDSFTTRERIKLLAEATGAEIEIHAHNDFGMATANTLAAVKGGARFISTTVSGIGERAGNASMEEVVMVMKELGKREMVLKGLNAAVFPALSEFVARAANRRVPVPSPDRNMGKYVYRLNALPEVSRAKKMN